VTSPGSPLVDLQLGLIALDEGEARVAVDLLRSAYLGFAERGWEAQAVRARDRLAQAQALADPAREQSGDLDG
jgi:hypothetical protein